MRLDRAGTRLAAGTVAAVAGYSSWRHIVEVASGVGEDGGVAAVLPLSVDGVVVVASLAMLEDKRAGLIPRWSARVALAFGIAATLAFNLGSAEPTWDARAVAAVPAIAFLLAVEVLSRKGKPAPVAVPVPAQHPAQPAPVVLERALEDPAVPPTGRPAELARDLPPATAVGTSPPVVTESPKVPARKPSRKERRQSAAETAAQVREAAARMPDATPEQIAAEVGTSERTVRRYLPAPPEPAVRPVISLVPAAPAELDVIPDPRHGGDRVPVGAAT